MNFKYFWGISILLLFLACKSNSDEGGLYQEKEGKVIYRGTLGENVTSHILKDPTSMHPLISAESYISEMALYSYERLTTLDPKTSEITPILAEALPEVSEDGLRFTYEIRDAAKWPDGAPITAADFVFSAKATMFPLANTANKRAFLSTLQDVQLYPDNPRKLTIICSEAYHYNPYFGAIIFILDRRFYDPNDALGAYSLAELVENETLQKDEALIAWADEFNDPKYGTDPKNLQNGSGPYHLIEWIQGERLVYTPNENYWGKDLEKITSQQYPPQITFRIIPDDQALIESIRQQSVDVSCKLVPDVYQVLKADSQVNQHYKVKRTGRGTVSMIGLNNQPDGVTHPKLFDDKRVRRAFLLGVDWDDLLFKRLELDGKRVAGPISENNPYFDATLPIATYNPDSARYYLKEAGWEDTDGDGILDKEVDGVRIPFAFNFLYRTTNVLEADMVREIANDLKTYGIEATPDNSGFKISSIVSGQYDAVLIPLIVPSLPYPFEGVYRSTSSFNLFGYANERADELIDKVSSNTNPEEARADAITLQKILIDDQPAIFLFNPARKMIAHKRYSNLSFYIEAPYIFLNSLEVVKE
ncbi:MAG: ABC transporter substrate-binding protein [Bacteroidota bacterium]